MQYKFLLLFILLFSNGQLLAQSVLNKTGLVKIATTTEGIYKIDFEFLQSASLNPNQVNPYTIQIYGMQGGSLPQANSVDYPTDPQPISIEVEANSNAVFEQGEVVYFYADRVQNVYFDFESESYQYENNIYADSLYYFVDFNAESPSKIVENVSFTEPTSGSVTINWFEDIQTHELDEINLLRSGRHWFGESFNVTRDRDFNFSFTRNLAANRQVKLRTNYMVQTFNSATLRIGINDFDLAQVDLPTVNDFSIRQFVYDLRGHIISENSDVSTSLLSGQQVKVQLSHISNGGGRSDGYLDNLLLSIPQELEPMADQIILRNSEFQKLGTYRIALKNAQNHKVWNVTDPISAKKISHQNGVFSFENNSNEREVKFVVFNEVSSKKPIFVDQVNSQNLKDNNIPDFLIITHSSFLSAANRLASYRNNHNQFISRVSTVEEIANEFGSGRKDVSAIRNYIKYLNDQNPGKLKYVLLMGAASYDYKNRLNNNTNFVPIYQSRNSLHPVFTYSSDDFYGFMEDDEGVWEETSSNVDDIDIGVGRIPCKTLMEAQNTVDKIINYETNPNTFRKWRNDVYFIADDGDNNLHQRDAESLNQYVVDNYSNYNINKLYLGAFEQEVFASLERSPKMQAAINEMIDKGALIVNFNGHGSETSWTDESILTRNMIAQWENKDKLPLFVTATCEFGRHDNPVIVSGAQDLILMKDGGAIGLLTTARPVSSASNYRLNESFYNSVFDRIGEGPKKLGDIMKQTKNNGIVGVSNRNFILLGDPALTLAQPVHQAVVTEILNEEGVTDTLKSMNKISVSGEIVSFTGNKMNNYSGVVVAEIFDKAVTKKTFEREEASLEFESFENVLYRGQGSISNGEFLLNFNMPKNLNYQIDMGKISMYVIPDEGYEDANGFNSDFYIGGSGNLNNNDKVGPDISIFMDDYSFINKDKVGSDATLLIQLYDEYGISISKIGLDNGIVFTLDNEEPIELNDYFYYDVDSYQQGEISYNFRNLEGGWHNLSVQAKDVNNNLSENNIEFFVVDNDQLEILNFVVYPNPAVSFSNFRLEQNRRNKETEVNYQIINTQGKLIHEHSFVTSDQKREDNWDLTNQNGTKVAPGLYFIRVFLRSVEDQAKTQEIKKLIVIN